MGRKTRATWAGRMRMTQTRRESPTPPPFKSPRVVHKRLGQGTQRSTQTELASMATREARDHTAPTGSTRRSGSLSSTGCSTSTSQRRGVGSSTTTSSSTPSPPRRTSPTRSTTRRTAGTPRRATRRRPRPGWPARAAGAGSERGHGHEEGRGSLRSPSECCVVGAARVTSGAGCVYSSYVFERGWTWKGCAS